MKGFVSLTVLAIIVISTILFVGAGYGVYTYQEIRKENTQIKKELEQEKESEIYRLQEELDTLKSDAEKNDLYNLNSSSTNLTKDSIEQEDELTKATNSESSQVQKPSIGTMPVVIQPVVETVLPALPTVQTDIYGMTTGEWASLESQIPSLEKRISEIKKIKSDLEDSLDSIQDMERSFLDWIPLLTSSGQKLAQDGLEVAGESRSLTYQEINYAQSVISSMNKVIDAIDNRNGSAYDSNILNISTQQEKWNSITSESKAKYTLLLSTYKNFSYYITGE
jgi:hypothetical protein